MGYQVPLFEHLVWLDLRLKPRSPGPLANTLPLGQWVFRYYSTPWEFFTRDWVTEFSSGLQSSFQFSILKIPWSKWSQFLILFSLLPGSFSGLWNVVQSAPTTTIITVNPMLHNFLIPWLHLNIFLSFHILLFAQSAWAWAVEYTDCFYAEG